MARKAPKTKRAKNLPMREKDPGAGLLARLVAIGENVVLFC